MDANALQVEPASLYDVGRTLSVAAEDGNDSFDTEYRDLSVATDSLFERSRSAMNSKAQSWRSRTNGLVARIDEHATGVHHTAAGFEFAENQNVDAMYRSSTGDESTLNLEV